MHERLIKPPNTLQAKELGGQAGDAVEQTANIAAVICRSSTHKHTRNQKHSQKTEPSASQAKELGGQAGDAVEQGANTAAEKTEEAGSAAEDYSKSGQQQVTMACRSVWAGF